MWSETQVINLLFAELVYKNITTVDHTLNLNISTRAILLLIMLLLLYRKMVEHNFRNVLIGQILYSHRKTFQLLSFFFFIIYYYYYNLKGNKATIIFTFIFLADAAPKGLGSKLTFYPNWQSEHIQSGWHASDVLLWVTGHCWLAFFLYSFGEVWV